jgi:transcriptional regulator with XRE-family HTH domain
MDYPLFRTRLLDARLRAQLTQAELAAKIDTQQPYICALEKGGREQLRAETLFRLAKALGVSAEWLAGETD